MQRHLFGQKRQGDPEASDGIDALFKDVKWRRKGTDRRCGTVCGDYVEKRACSDRRHDFMSLVSYIIFPKGWAKN